MDARRLWDEASDRVVSRLLRGDAAAALAAARRAEKISAHTHEEAKETMSLLLRYVDVVEASANVVGSAAGLAELLSLRGYDAVQLASATQALEDDGVVATFDKELIGAASPMGINIG